MKVRYVFLISLLLTAIILVITFNLAHAQTAEELLQTPGLTADQRAAIAEAIAKKGETDSIVPKTLEGILEWQEMGTAFATTIESVCKTLRVEVNEFLRSEVGMLTAGVIIYKMVGKDILRIVLYTNIWFGITIIFFFSIKFLHMKKLVPGTIKDKKNPENVIQTTVAIDRFGWENDIVKNFSLVIHLIVWFGFSCIMAANVI